MSGTPSNGADTDRLPRSAFGALAIIKHNLQTNGYNLSPEKEEDMVIAALAWHEGHLAVIGVKQDELDPFKMICWFGGTLFDQEEDEKQHDAIFLGIIEALEEVLFIRTGETITVSVEDRLLVKRMLWAEQNDQCEHGIGFNGLYLAFHFACATVTDLSDRNLIKEATDDGVNAPQRTEVPAEKGYPGG